MKKQNDNPNAFKNFISPQTIEKYYLGVKNLKRPLAVSTLASLKLQLNDRELKQRVHLIRDFLHQHLEKDYKKSIKQLQIIIKEQNLSGFELWPATEFIQAYGLEDKELSLEALYKITPLFTSEFGIRPFLNKYNDIIYKQLLSWSKDPNPHIRRWLSEGTRPRLPWGEKLIHAIKDPSHGLRILEQLKFDSELYVRKSVSNHLNDIAKDHPHLVIQTLKAWQKQVPANYLKEFTFIKKQALRTLIKQGHQDALKLMGVQLRPNDFQIQKIKIKSKNLKMNQYLEFECKIKNSSRTTKKFILDYKIHHLKANGQLSAKVFKLRSGSINPGESLVFKKRHLFKQITTRVYYSGQHKLELVLNGASIETIAFALKV